MINSMLGLLVFPQQKYFNRIPERTLEELRNQGWPVPTMKGTPPKADTLPEPFTTPSKTALATSISNFMSDGHVLTGIRIWNCQMDSCGRYVKEKGHRVREWEQELDINELRDIARKFVALLLDGDL